MFITRFLVKVNGSHYSAENFEAAREIASEYARPFLTHMEKEDAEIFMKIAHVSCEKAIKIDSIPFKEEKE